MDARGVRRHIVFYSPLPAKLYMSWTAFTLLSPEGEHQMSSRSVILVILLVLVAVIVAGCSPADTPPVADTHATVDATPGTPDDADLSGAIAHTQAYAFFRGLARLAGG